MLETKHSDNGTLAAERVNHLLNCGQMSHASEILSNPLIQSSTKMFRVPSKYLAAQYQEMLRQDPGIPKRLALLQAAMVGEDRGATSRMTALLGIKYPRWHGILTGKNRLSLEVLQTLARVTGVSPDWILSGNVDALSVHWARTLGQLKRPR